MTLCVALEDFVVTKRPAHALFLLAYDRVSLLVSTTVYLSGVALIC